MSKGNIYLSKDEEAMLLYALEMCKERWQTDRDKSMYFGLRGKLRGSDDIDAQKHN